MQSDLQTNIFTDFLNISNNYFVKRFFSLSAINWNKRNFLNPALDLYNICSRNLRSIIVIIDSKNPLQWFLYTLRLCHIKTCVSYIKFWFQCSPPLGRKHKHKYRYIQAWQNTWCFLIWSFIVTRKGDYVSTRQSLAEI